MAENFLKLGGALEKPIDLRALLSQDGTTFEIPMNEAEEEDEDMDFMDAFAQNGANECSDDESSPIGENTIKSPWENSFDMLRSQCTKITEFIYKKIIQEGDKASRTVPSNYARAHIRYSGYFEKHREPFDSTYLRGTTYKYVTGGEDVLPGIDQAVRTMRAGETAQFVISYQLLYGELGCPPRIPKKADALFSINLVKFELVGDMTALDDTIKTDKNGYASVIGNVKQMHLSGLDAFQYKKYAKAAQIFLKAADALNEAEVTNDAESSDKNEFLIKLYTNLAVCYNKKKAARKALNMVEAARELTKNELPSKIHYHEGVAYMLLGEYGDARKSLLKAAKLEPKNPLVHKKLFELNDLIAKYKTSEKQLWRKAWGATNGNSATISDSVLENPHLDNFEKEITELMSDMHLSDDINLFRLPNGLSSEEIAIVSDLSKRFNVNLTIKETDYNVEYILEKPKAI